MGQDCSHYLEKINLMICSKVLLFLCNAVSQQGRLLLFSSFELSNACKTINEFIVNIILTPQETDWIQSRSISEV